MMRPDFLKIFSVSKPVIGMIHVAALPGTPDYRGDMSAIIAQAREEALIYLAAGIDALAIENMHDVPYLNRNVGPEITAAMSVVGYEVKQVSGLPVGIQILAGANQAALAAAIAAGLDFVRAEGFVFSHIADEGQMNSDAGVLLRYRKQLGADNITVLTDIKKKHGSHTITGDIDIAETAQAAEFFLSDGVIVTGKSTGQSALTEEIEAVKQAVDIPVLVGSGVTVGNVERFLSHSDGLIVGSHFKQDGNWRMPVDKDRVIALMEKVNSLRNQ